MPAALAGSEDGSETGSPALSGEARHGGGLPAGETPARPDGEKLPKYQITCVPDHWRRTSLLIIQRVLRSPEYIEGRRRISVAFSLSP